MTAARVCAAPDCSNVLTGRKDKEYCGVNCRSRAIYHAKVAFDATQPRVCAAVGCTEPLTRQINQTFCSKDCQMQTYNRRRQAARSGLPTAPSRLCAAPDCTNPVTGMDTKRFCSPACKQRTANRYSNPKRTRAPHPVAVCASPYCNNEFVMKDRRSKFCNYKCGMATASYERTGFLFGSTAPCEQCGTEITRRAARERFCSKRCNSAWKNAQLTRDDRYPAAIRERMRKLGNTAERDRTITPSEVIALFNNICQGCQQPCADRETTNQLDPLYPTVDHKIPLSMNGPHTRENVQLMHRSCNARKSVGQIITVTAPLPVAAPKPMPKPVQFVTCPCGCGHTFMLTNAA